MEGLRDAGGEQEIPGFVSIRTGDGHLAMTEVFELMDVMTGEQQLAFSRMSTEAQGELYRQILPQHARQAGDGARKNGMGEGEGFEGKGDDGEWAGGFSAAHFEVAVMVVTQPRFDVNTTRCSDGSPPIIFAVGARRSQLYGPANEEGCLAFVLGLPGVDVNLQEVQTGQTALCFAASRGAWRRVKILLAARSIDVNLADNAGRTPLWAAVNQEERTAGEDQGHLKCVELLLQAPGIQINKADQDGKTPLGIAAIKCLKLLLKAPGIAVNKATKDGRTPLTSASNLGKFKCIEALIEDPRVDINQPLHDGSFPLWHACVHVRTAMNGMGACDGRTDDNTDPIRGLVLLLRSRRVSEAAFDQAIKNTRQSHREKGHFTEREIAQAEREKSCAKLCPQKGLWQDPLMHSFLMAQHILPILEAQAKGKRRWCDWCYRVTPDKDLLLCGGCQQVGYCDRLCCQKKAWKEGGHKEACAGMAAEAAKAKAGGGKDAGGGGGCTRVVPTCCTTARDVLDGHRVLFQ